MIPCTTITVLNTSEINANMLLNGLNLTETSKTMFINDTYQIETNLISDNDDKSITYTSNDPQIASVDEQGVVTALKRGTVKIIVENKAGGYREEVLITVKKNISITSKIPMYQLSENNLSDIEKAPNTDRQYLGQPDMVRTKTGRLITAYPKTPCSSTEAICGSLDVYVIVLSSLSLIKLVYNNTWTKTNKTILPLDIIGGTGFTGYIDEIKVYNRVLNNSEILLPQLSVASLSSNE